jgi:phosphoenolpyruvate-protein kinase (PTS system EI component)
VLVGLGIRTLSMNSAALGGVRRALSQYTLAEMEHKAQEMCNQF